MTVSHVFPDVMGSYKPDEKPANKRKSRGYSIDRGWSGPVILPDVVVKEIRWLYEFGGWSLNDISKAYKLTYGYTYKLVIYATRSKVTVKQKDFTIGHRQINHKEPS